MTSIIRIYLYCIVKIERDFKQEHEMAYGYLLFLILCW